MKTKIISTAGISQECSNILKNYCILLKDKLKDQWEFTNSSTHYDVCFVNSGFNCSDNIKDNDNSTIVVMNESSLNNKENNSDFPFKAKTVRNLLNRISSVDSSAHGEISMSKFENLYDDNAQPTQKIAVFGLDGDQSSIVKSLFEQKNIVEEYVNEDHEKNFSKESIKFGKLKSNNNTLKLIEVPNAINSSALSNLVATDSDAFILFADANDDNTFDKIKGMIQSIHSIVENPVKIYCALDSNSSDNTNYFELLKSLSYDEMGLENFFTLDLTKKNQIQSIIDDISMDLSIDNDPTQSRLMFA